MSVLICAARKMFPKRKLNESGSGSDSQKEEAEVKEEQGQQNKRPRVETSASGEGMLSLLLLTKHINNTFCLAVSHYQTAYFPAVHGLIQPFVSRNFMADWVAIIKSNNLDN